MVSTFSSNIQLEEPARGDQVGVWDTPVNSNMNVVDLISGGIATVTLNNSPVVLASGQYQCREIVFSSTLTGSVSITFPTSFRKNYEIYNTCTGSSAFVVTLQTTVAGGQVICAPPGEIVDVRNDGTNIRFKNLGRVGQFWDYGGSSVPAWVSGCTVAPYLNCDGTAFSSATFPFLTNVLGGTTLPDIRGRTRATLNQGTGRITTAGGGVDGNTNLSAGGLQTITISASNVPPIAASGTNTITVASTVGGKPNFPVTAGSVGQQPSPSTGGGFVPTTTAGGGDWTTASQMVGSNGISVTSTGAGGTISNLPPITIAGLCMIRTG